MRTTISRTAALATLSLVAFAGCGSASQDTPVEAPTIAADIEDELEPSDGGEVDPVAAPQIDGESDAEEQEQETVNDKGGPGVYQAEMWGGATATVAVPGTPPEDVEQFRKDAGVDPVGYLIVEVDNTEGSDEALLWEARVVDSEGKTHRYEEVMTGITDWTGNNYELMDREMELWDKYPYAVDPTAKATVPLIGPEVPEDIVSVFVEDERAEWVGDL